MAGAMVHNASQASPPTGFSEGQEAVGLPAAVLMDEPDVLLLDGPCAGLDHRLTARLMKTLLGLPQRLIMATHQLKLLQGFGGDLDRGRQVQMQGPASAVVRPYAASGR